MIFLKVEENIQKQDGWAERNRFFFVFAATFPLDLDIPAAKLCCTSRLTWTNLCWRPHIGFALAGCLWADVIVTVQGGVGEVRGGEGG